MDINQFWKLNEGLPVDEAVEVITQRLMALDPTEIESYQKHFSTLFAAAYQWRLWGAAYIIDGGCSDDGFTDFRRGLISRGRAVFEAAVGDPDSLADFDDIEGDCDIPNQSFGYVAQRVYKEKTGVEMPDNDVAHPPEPLGENWDFDDAELCAQKLPRIWAKFGY